MRLPSLAFLAALFLFPLYPKIGLIRVQGTYIPVRIDDLIVAALALIWIAALVRARRWPEFPRTVSLLALAWIACGLVALVIGAFLLNTVALLEGFAYWAKPIEYLLLGLIAYDLVRTGSLNPRAVLVTVFAAAAVVVAYGLLERAGVLPRLPGQSPIPNSVLSTVGDPHELATYLGIIVILGIALWHRAPGPMRGLLVAIVIGGAGVMFFTAARTEWIALIVCLLALAAWRPVRLQALLVLGLVVVMTLAGPLSQMVGSRFPAGPTSSPPVTGNPGPGSPAPSPTPRPDNPNTVTDRFLEAAFYSTLGSRLLRWPRLIEVGMRNPLLGAGPSAATEAADNYYIRSFVEVGLVGTAVFLALLVAVARAAWRARRSDDPLTGSLARGLVAAMLFLAIVGLLIDSWVASRVMELFWPLAGALLAMSAASVVRVPIDPAQAAPVGG